MPDLRRWFCRTEQVTLHFGTAQRAQQFLLLFGLDALGRRRHIACRGDIHHRLHDAGGAVRFGDVVDETAVDLDLVKRKPLQVAQRGISGAEIVQCDAYPDRAKLMQNGQRGFIVADQDRFGDLELQPACRKTRRRKRRNSCCRNAGYGAT